MNFWFEPGRSLCLMAIRAVLFLKFMLFSTRDCAWSLPRLPFVLDLGRTKVAALKASTFLTRFVRRAAAGVTMEKGPLKGLIRLFKGSYKAL